MGNICMRSNSTVLRKRLRRGAARHPARRGHPAGVAWRAAGARLHRPLPGRNAEGAPAFAPRSDAQHVHLAADPKDAASSRSCCSPRITEHPDWPESERGDLLGECDLIMSFLMYNDISAMSRLHRSASAQMSRPAISIQKSGGWTFGSPSVLMMFYRAPGAAARASSPRWTSACRTTIRSQTATGRALRPSCARRPTSCAPALPTRRSCSSAPMRRLTATGRKTWPCAATFSPGGSRSALLSRRASPLSSGVRRCCSSTTSHGSTFCKAPAPITMRCWDCPKKFPRSSASINSPPSTSSRPESR